MRIVGIENGICDYYLFDKETQINGGGTVSNILVNLDFFHVSCKLVGYIGKDDQGKWIYRSLNKTKIDLKDFKMIDAETKCFYMDQKGYSSTCPICHKKKKRYPSLKIKDLQKIIERKDILLIKDYSKTNEKILNQFKKNSILIDIGYIKPLLYLEKETLTRFIHYPFSIMSIKEEVLNFIMKQLGLTKEKLLNNMNTELVVITKGKKGAEFYYQKKLYVFQLKEPLKEVETNGCGDAFFSIIIKEFCKKQTWNEEQFQKLFLKASEYVKIVLNNIGPRNHIIPNGKVIHYEKCLCEKLNIE